MTTTDRPVMLSAVLDAIRLESCAFNATGDDEEGMLLYRKPLCRRIEALPTAPTRDGVEALRGLRETFDKAARDESDLDRADVWHRALIAVNCALAELRAAPPARVTQADVAPNYEAAAIQLCKELYTEADYAPDSTDRARAKAVVDAAIPRHPLSGRALAERYGFASRRLGLFDPIQDAPPAPVVGSVEAFPPDPAGPAVSTLRKQLADAEKAAPSAAEQPTQATGEVAALQTARHLLATNPNATTSDWEKLFTRAIAALRAVDARRAEAERGQDEIVTAVVEAREGLDLDHTTLFADQVRQLRVELDAHNLAATAAEAERDTARRELVAVMRIAKAPDDERVTFDPDSDAQIQIVGLRARALAAQRNANESARAEVARLTALASEQSAPIDLDAPGLRRALYDIYCNAYEKNDGPFDECTDAGLMAVARHVLGLARGALRHQFDSEDIRATIELVIGNLSTPAARGDSLGVAAEEAVDIARKAASSWPAYNSAHEALGKLDEEYAEFRRIVHQREGERDASELRKEALDVACVALRTAAVCTPEWVKR